MSRTPNCCEMVSSNSELGVIPRMRNFSMLFFAVLVPLTLSHAEDTQRRTTKYFKGVELYSWRDAASHTWRFSLLPGTNRLKTLAEITDPARTITSVEALKQQLGQLAVGEYVIWRSPDPKQAYPSLPSKQVTDDVAETAKTLKLNLTIPTP